MKPEMKKLIIANLPYLLFVYLFGKLGQTYRLAAGADLSEKLLHLADGFSLAFESAAPSFHLFDLAVGVAGAVALRLMVYCKSKNAKKYRRGVEYGSARWGSPKDIAPYIDPVFDNNILLTQTERLTMNNRPKDPKTARNKNVLVIGGSGSGKTRFFVKPNLMQCVSKDYPTSFVITDPKGSLIGEVGQLLVRCGYRVKVLNTINFSKSMRYNPFRYIHSEKDILKLVNTLICNTKGEGEKSAEDFWIKSERLLYSALIGYIWYEAPDDEMNFTTLLEMINASEAREDDPEFQSPVDQMFERLEEKDPEHFAVRQYRKFLLSAGKTRSSILISCGARLAPFDIREVRELMEDDELELDTIGDKKTALFLIMSDTDTTFNFILAMVQSQLINLLCDRADDKYGGRLPVHVRLILDEFANIGQIPNFDKLIATIRSREISASIILQSQSQLKAIYKDAAEIISDNCDCTLFLSGRGKNAKEIAEVLGKETIDSYNQSENRGAQTSHGLNYQKLGKEVQTRRGEIADGKYIREAIYGLKEPPQEETVEIIRMSEVDTQTVEWLWEPYIPFGKVTIVQGNPGEGKTTLALRLCAACTNRKPFPAMAEHEPFNVIYQTAEDGLGDTVKPRLMEADADLDRVLVIDEGKQELSLSDERIERAIRQTGARLIILDPIQAYVGEKTDMNKANEIRPIFRRLAEVAERTGCAVVLIGHLNKAAGGQSAYRGLGSIDFRAAARSVLLIGRVKREPNVRVIIHDKSSLAPEGKPMAFSLGAESGFSWIGEYDITADELLSGTGGNTETKTEQAERLILDLLADGKEMASEDIVKAAAEAGISERTVQNAKRSMGGILGARRVGSQWYNFIKKKQPPETAK